MREGIAAVGVIRWHQGGRANHVQVNRTRRPADRRRASARSSSSCAQKKWPLGTATPRPDESGGPACALMAAGQGSGFLMRSSRAKKDPSAQRAVCEIPDINSNCFCARPRNRITVVAHVSGERQHHRHCVTKPAAVSHCAFLFTRLCVRSSGRTVRQTLPGERQSSGM